MKQVWAIVGIVLAVAILSVLPKGQSSPSPMGTGTPSPAPSPVVSKPPLTRTEIAALGSGSACSAYSWKDRGRMPKAFFAGMAISVAQAKCSPNPVLRQALGTDKDVLTHYAEALKAKGIKTGTEDERVIALYTLLVGLGARESSGRYCVGRDTTAGSQTAIEAESGLFQQSANINGVSTRMVDVQSRYKANPSLCVPEFKVGVTCAPQATVGTGPGAEFQVMAKDCPGFATEHAATGMRLVGGPKGHWGPLRRLEAEVNTDCYGLVKRVYDLVVCP